MSGNYKNDFTFEVSDESENDNAEIKFNSEPQKKNSAISTKRIRVIATVTQEKKEEIEKFVKENHISSITDFVQTAIDFYLVAQKGDDKSQSVIIGQDAASEIHRALEPIENENKRRDRTTKILLNAIWHMLQINSNIDENTLEQIVTRAVREIDNAGNSFTANEILDGAIAEKNATHKFYSSAPEKNVIHDSANSEQKNFAEQKNYAPYSEASRTQTPSYDNSRFNQYSDSSDRSKQKQNNEADSDPLLNYDS